MHLIEHHLEPQGMEPGATLHGDVEVSEAEPHPKGLLLLTRRRPLFGLKCFQQKIQQLKSLIHP
jgi:hypothetical protein